MSKPNNNIILRKKSLDNGDLSKHLNKSAALKNTIQKINEKMDAFNTNLENKNNLQFNKSQTFSNARKEKEKNEFVSNVKTVQHNQEALMKKMRQTPFQRGNRNNFFISSQKLPKTVEEIEENSELVKILLKNPKEMTEEEKAYIASFNNDEFARFIEFLKMKDQEVKWRGNDWGSGHYWEGYINIYRETGGNEKERYLSLRNFLKLNYNNRKATQNIQFSGSNDFAPTNLEPDSLFTKNLNTDMESYEGIAKEMANELDMLRNTILLHKNDIQDMNMEVMNGIISKDIERKTKVMKDDVNKITSLQTDNKSDVEILCEKLKKTLTEGNNKFQTQEATIIQKIRNYYKKMNISALEFVKRLDHYGFEDSTVSLKEAHLSFLNLKILTEKESLYLCNLLRKFLGDDVKYDLFVCFLESEDNIKTIEEIILETEFEEEDMEADENAKNYDYNSYNKSDFSRSRDEKKRKTMTAKHLGDFEMLMKKKSAICIQKMVKGMHARREFFITKAYYNIMAKRITRLLRENYEIVMKKKNEAALKITYLMRKFYWDKHDMGNISKTSAKWILHFNYKSLSSLPHSNKNLNRCAVAIQRAWKRYKSSMIDNFFEKNASKMDMNILKTKICFVCCVNRVTHLCKDCDDNHYCEQCFLKYHMRGVKRNHSYLRIANLIEEMKLKKEKLVTGGMSEIAVVKKYLSEKKINLHQILKMWDFNNNDTILYKHLRDALCVKGFNIDSSIKDLILSIAVKTIITEKIGKGDFNDSSTKASHLDNLCISLDFCYELV